MPARLQTRRSFASYCTPSALTTTNFRHQSQTRLEELSIDFTSTYADGLTPVNRSCERGKGNATYWRSTAIPTSLHLLTEENVSMKNNARLTSIVASYVYHYSIAQHQQILIQGRWLWSNCSRFENRFTAIWGLYLLTGLKRANQINPHVLFYYSKLRYSKIRSLLGAL